MIALKRTPRIHRTRSRREGGNSTSRAFTLVEAVLVMLILVAMAVISYPSLTDLETMRLRSATKLAAQQVRYAQWLAMTSGVTHGVLFSTGENSYSVFRSNTSNVVTDPHSKGRSLTVSFSGEENFKGVSIVSVNFGGAGKPSVKFSSLGVPQDSGGVALTSTGRVILGAGSVTDTVEVLPTTGKARY